MVYIRVVAKYKIVKSPFHRIQQVKQWNDKHLDKIQLKISFHLRAQKEINEFCIDCRAAAGYLAVDMNGYEIKI